MAPPVRRTKDGAPDSRDPSGPEHAQPPQHTQRQQQQQQQIEEAAGGGGGNNGGGGGGGPSGKLLASLGVLGGIGVLAAGSFLLRDQIR